MTIHAAEYWNCSGGANLSSPNNNTRTPCHKTIETIVQEPACVIAIDYTGFAIYCQLNKKKSLGGDLLSQGVAPQVPLALTGFTTGFGMGPGVPPSLQPPRDFFSRVLPYHFFSRIVNDAQRWFEECSILPITGKALGH